MACSPRPATAESSRRSTVAGPSVLSYAMPRSSPRSWAMSAAASVSCRTTSPMTTTVDPSGCAMTSYQSPPTWASRAAGT